MYWYLDILGNMHLSTRDSVVLVKWGNDIKECKFTGWLKDFGIRNEKVKVSFSGMNGGYSIKVDDIISIDDFIFKEFIEEGLT